MKTETYGFILDAVTVIRGQARLLEEVSGQVPAGRCTAVVGPSGAGKSSLLRVFNRLEEPSTGRVLLGDVPITSIDVLALRARVGLVAQRPVLLTDRVADETSVGRPGLSDQRIAELLARVGLPVGFGGRRTVELSGGEAQRVCLARALALEPEVLLLDEPTSALDGLNAALVGELARDHVSAGGTVVLASHDLAIVRNVADWVLVLNGGRLVGAGRPDVMGYLETG
ncbi:MAG: ATP-binding cassette domain-containing protein [Actinomycetota bacterium]|nr:ATP-binding cassette domain-containing protein [Actinomycetota bacterium]